MVFGCVGIMSLYGFGMYHCTHSKYDFIVVSPTPRFSFLHKIHLVFLLRSYCSLNLFNAKATNIHLIATKQFFK